MKDLDYNPFRLENICRSYSVNEEFYISGSGYPNNQAFTLVIYHAAGDIILQKTYTATGQGTFLITIGVEDSDPKGSYYIYANPTFQNLNADYGDPCFEVNWNNSTEVAFIGCNTNPAYLPGSGGNFHPSGGVGASSSHIMDHTENSKQTFNLVK